MAILITCQMIRLVSFINVYGGIEHDSGWALGTARSLAETGSYVSMVNTIDDGSEAGGHISVHDRYNVQDELGRIYFSPESIGPGSIIPNAIAIKIFGAGFWQYRTAPLLFFFVFMVLASYLLYQVGGVLAVIIAHLFLFFYPHLIIFLGYEAMGEIFSLTYILLAFVLLLVGIQKQKYRWIWFFGCGLVAGLTIITKLVGLLALSGLVVVCMLTFWEKRMSLKEGVAVLFGWILPFIIWELVQLLSLTLLFDFQTYKGFKDQFFTFFLMGGSGVNNQSSRDLAYIWHKLLVVREISLFNDVISLIAFVIILVSGPFLVWRYASEMKQRNIVILIWSGWLTTSIWFILFSQNGWVRHNWNSLIFGVFLLSLLTAYFWQHVNSSPKWINRAAAFIMTGLLIIGFIGQINTPDFFRSDRLVEKWYNEHLAASHARTPWIIIPRLEQEAAAQILQDLPNSAHVFYPQGYKAAELATLSGRVFYPVHRRKFMPQNKEDVILIGPTVISPWRKPYEEPMSKIEQQSFIEELYKQIRRECPQVIFENDYYVICSLEY